jgi:hypothetical protein
MNRDSITLILSILLLLGSSATAGLCYWFLQCTRQEQQAQFELARVNQNRALLQSFAAEAGEYSKKNPSILPILQSFGVRLRSETNAPAVPQKK